MDGASERDIDVPAAVGPAGREPERPEPGRDIGSADVIAFGAGVAAFEQVACKEFNVGTDTLPGAGMDGRRGGRRDTPRQRSDYKLQSLHKDDRHLRLLPH